MYSDADFMKSAQNKYFHKSDWYKGYGSSANFYIFDAKGGTLNNHFVSIRDKYEDRIKNSKIDNFKKERIGEIKVEYDKELAKYKGIFECTTRMLSVQGNGVNVLGSDLLDYPRNLLQLGKTSITKEYKGVKINDQVSGSEDDIIRENIKQLKLASMKLYVDLVQHLLISLVSVGESNPVTLKTIMHYSDRAVRVPSSCEGLNSAIEQISGKSFSGERWNDSVANCCWLTCKYFCSNCGQRSITRFQNKEYWMEVLNEQH